VAEPRSKKPSFEQEQAIDEGIDLVRQAMRDVLAKPKAEREAHLAQLLEKIEAMSGRLEGAGEVGTGGDRLRALHTVFEILRRMAADAP
jgi:hypothetical protein